MDAMERRVANHYGEPVELARLQVSQAEFSATRPAFDPLPPCFL